LNRFNFFPGGGILKDPFEKHHCSNLSKIGSGEIL
jgi:hypothetical protein